MRPVRMDTDSGLYPVRRYPRAQSRPVTDLGALAIACGEPRIEELLALLDNAVVPGRRIDILQEIARVYRDDLDDNEAAIVALRAALHEDFRHEGVATALHDLVEGTGGWMDLMSELIRDAETLAQDNERMAADLWVRMARWYLEPLGYRGYATEALRHALELAPDNVDALSMLATIWREDGFFLELSDVLKRLAAATTDPAARVEVLLTLADVADTHLDDHATAIAACDRALDLDPTCMAVYDALRAMLRRTECVAELADTLARHATMVDDADDAVELAVDIARLYEERLGDQARADETWQRLDADAAIACLEQLLDADPSVRELAALHHRIGQYRRASDEGRAEWHLCEALAHVPGHVPSACALADMYTARGDFRKACMMYERAIDNTEDSELRVELVTNRARILADELDDLDAAATACREALATDRRSVGLALVLARVCARLGQWEDMRAMLSGLESDIVAAGDQADIQTLYRLIAQASEELGDHDNALAYFNEAHAMSPGDTDTHSSLADQFYAREQWNEAAREYRLLLEEAGGNAGLNYRLGVSLRNSGHMTGALDAFTTVTNIEPDHIPALRAGAELLSTLGRWPAAADALESLLERTGEEDHASLRLQLGDIYRDHLDQPRRALAEYTAAAAATPDDHAALQRKLDTATELGDWSVAVDTIEHFASTEADDNRRGTYLHAAAVVYRDELRALDTAAETFEAALDAFFAECPVGADLTRSLRTFAELDTLHTQRRAWEDQADAYQRMIARLPAGHPVLVELWHALGEVYRSRLDDLNMAATAFEAARALEPDHVERRAILAELYQIARDEDAAAHEHHAMLVREPGRADSYRALEQLYRAAGNMDQAWCAARALVFLDRAEPADEDLFERYHAHAFADMKGCTLTPEMHEQLVPHNTGGTISLAMALVRPVAANLRPNIWRVRTEQRIDVELDRTPRVRMIAHVAAALGVDLPDLYDQAKKAGTLAFGLHRTRDETRTVIALRGDHMRASEVSAAFHAGRALCLLDPTRVLTTAFEAAELDAVLNWIVGRPDDSKLTSELTRSAQKVLRPDQHEQLLRIQRRLEGTEPERALNRWRRISAIAADRVGFVVCGDLKAAATAIAELDDDVPGLTAHARILELLRFSVTPEHAAIRRHLCGRI